MSGKPSTEYGYESEGLKYVRKTCLYAATKLGDLFEDAVIVGGFVPSLLIDEISPGNKYSNHLSKHVGTLDLDLGLSLGLLNTGRYKEFAKRLRNAGFENDIKPNGETRTHRWVLKIGGQSIEIGFLIGKCDEKEGGEILNIEEDFSAIVTPGLHLAFEDYEKVELSGHIPSIGAATREINVAGPAAFIILKTLAFDLRGTNKDAYDMYYVLRNYEGGSEKIVPKFSNFADSPMITKTLSILKRDFFGEDMIGPQSVANFLASTEEEAVVKADVVAFISDFVKRLEQE